MERSRSRSRSRSPKRGYRRRRDRSPSPDFRDHRRRDYYRGNDYRSSRSDDYKKYRASTKELYGGLMYSLPKFLQATNKHQNDISLRDYEEYVKNFQERHARSFYETHKNEPWLDERYHPTQVAKRIVERAAETKERVETFTARYKAEELVPKSFDYEEIIEKCPDIKAGEFGSGKQEEQQNDETSETATDTLIVTNVTCNITTSVFHGILQVEGTQVIDLHVSLPKPAKQFSRDALVKYDSVESATTAKAALEGKTIEMMPISCAFRSSEDKAPLLVPAIAASEERLKKDLEQAATLAKVLDEEKEVTAGSGSVALFGEDNVELTEKQRLDYLILYLRNVHLYCYYSWSQFESLLELPGRSPIFYRAKPTDTVDPKDEVWAETLDFNVTDKIAKRPNKDEECGKRETERQLEMLVTRKSKADDEGRFRCTECTKLFMTHEFVRKHIHNKHQDLIEKSGRDALDEQCFKNFLADPNKVISTEPSRKEVDEDRRSMSPESDFKRRGNLKRHRKGPPPPIPDNVKHDPRDVRQYRDLDNVGVEDVEIDYRLL